ncbi:DEAD/DEAH box helicase [Rivibacter subsaxonicus]|nr:DEAD/DEAH box helicase [Rivibacter subsaxonicus]
MTTSFDEALGLPVSETISAADASANLAALSAAVRADVAPTVVTDTEVAAPAAAATTEPAPANGFAVLGLIEPLLASVASLGFTSPTPVQAEAVPAALAGGDWMVSAQTGSGKTAAFLLPVLQRLLDAPVVEEARISTPRAIVLCPTRELAQQVAEDAINLMRGVVISLKNAGKNDPYKMAARGLRIASVVGGVPYGKQIFDLRGAQLVIATPGRLLDLQDRGQIRLDAVQCLVVDEADRMLDLGFADDLAAIHDHTSARESTQMFSATFAPRIMALAARVMREPQRLALANAGDKHADITQTLHWADNIAHKGKLLEHWLRDASLVQAVVFASTQVDTETIAETLQQNGHAAVALHGAMPQATRNRRLQNLRDGRIRILVATDVAARGIDVPSISHVINFGLPMKAEDYVHRIGRTGRAGRSGQAITIAEHRERHKIRAIEQYTRQPLQASEIEGLEPKAQPVRPSKPMPGSRHPGRNSFGANKPRGGFGGGDREQGFAPRRDEGFHAPRRDEGFAPARPARNDGGFAAHGRNDGGFAPRRDEGGFAPRREHGFGGDNRRGPNTGFDRAPGGAPRKFGSGSR